MRQPQMAVKNSTVRSFARKAERRQKLSAYLGRFGMAHRAQREQRANIRPCPRHQASTGLPVCLISREVRRKRDACGGYSAHVAQQQMQARCQMCRPMRKLLPGSERFELGVHRLRERLAPAARPTEWPGR